MKLYVVGCDGVIVCIHIIQSVYIQRGSLYIFLRESGVWVHSRGFLSSILPKTDLALKSVPVPIGW